MDKLELLTEQYKNCCAENDALKAENARYREALEFYSLFDFKGNPHFQAIAREVLKVGKSCE